VAIYTSQDLLDSINNKVFIPSTQDTFTDEDLLKIATDEMRDYILPKIKQTREEFFVTEKDHTVTTDTDSIVVPDRAVGNAFRDVQLIQGGVKRILARLDLEDRVYESNSGPLRGYYFEGNKIKLIGSLTGTVRLYYVRRPGRLVLPSEAGSITSITPGASTTVIAVSTIPSSWGAAETVDMIRSTSGFSTLVDDVSATISGTDITVANTDVPSDLAVGDWVSLQDTSPVPQVPAEWFSFLAQSVASQVLESQGDFEALSRSDMKKDKMEANALSLITARVQGQSKKIVSPHNRGYSGYDWWT
jgi:hypothetical protein